MMGLLCGVELLFLRREAGAESGASGSLSSERDLVCVYSVQVTGL